MEQLLLPKLSNAQRVQRLKFAQDNVDRDWLKVIFYDRKKVGKIDVFGSMTWYGLGGICFVNGRYKCDEYVSMIEGNLKPLLHSDENMVLIRNTAAAIDNSYLCRTWVDKYPSIEVLDWPQRNDDLNPMKKIWRNIQKRLDPFDDVDMKDQIINSWYRQRDEDEVCDLYIGMTRTMKEVIQNKGEYIK